MRLVFMGTPEFALPTLKALVEAGHDIAAVYSQPPRPAGRGQKDTPSPVHTFAESKGLKVFTPTSLKSPEVQAEFASHKAEAAVVVAYGLLLPKAILDTYPLGCINVHPSLLPRWRGAAPIQRTIMAGDRETGICIMQMGVGLDTGDILLMERHSFPDGTTAGMLHDTLAQKAGPLVLKTLEGLKNKSVKPQKQAADGVTYANKITKEECRLDWRKPARDLYYQVMGLSPSPGASFSYGGEIIKVFDACYEPVATCDLTGTVIDDMLAVCCKPGVIRLKELQRPGKKRIEAEELLRGFALPKGTLLT